MLLKSGKQQKTASSANPSKTILSPKSQSLVLGLFYALKTQICINHIKLKTFYYSELIQLINFFRKKLKKNFYFYFLCGLINLGKLDVGVSMLQKKGV